MVLFRILFVFDSLFLLVLAYFFFDGLRYASSGGSSAIWLLLLGVPIALLAGAWGLRSRSKVTAANVMLALLAVPPFLYLLFIGAIILLEPNWR